MKTTLTILSAVVLLAACGGPNRVDRSAGGVAPLRLSSGPIADGCMTSGRRDANARLCGCIQGVADGSLSMADQRLAQRFFSDPHHAQEIRMSDNPRHDSFWDRYTAFADNAERLCTAYR